MKNNFYVYVYLDPLTPGEFIYNNIRFNYQPFYIGKGSGNRLLSHLKEAKNKENCLNNEAKKLIGDKNRGLFLGDKNVSKRQDVRNKIGLANLGKNNKMSKTWRITFPDGHTEELIGGFKKFCRENNISDQTFRRNGFYKNWKLECLEK